MKFAVVGGSGITGSAAIRDLLASKDTEHIQVIDLQEKRFEDPRVSFRRVDIRNHEELSRTLKGSDVVINAAQYYFNLDVMKACLQAKVPYIDFGGLFHMTRKQMELDDTFAREGVLAIIGMGAQPGISSVAASYAVNRMDTAESVVIRDGWADRTPNAPYLFTWSPLTMIDEMTMNAVHFEDGKFVESPPLSRSEVYDFGPEIGQFAVYRTLHSEIATMPESFRQKGIRYVEWLEGSRDILLLKQVVDMGFGSTEKVKVNGAEIVPREFFINFLRQQGKLTPPEGIQVMDYERTVVEVRGKEAGREKRVVITVDFKYDERLRMSASQKQVGVPGSIVAQMVASGTIKGKGVKPPEQIVPPKLFFPELAKRDIKVRSVEASDLN